MNIRIALLIVLLVCVSAAAQELTWHEKAWMVGCALNGGKGEEAGSSVESSLYANRKVRFTYTLVPPPPEKKGFLDLYVVFWNRARTEGRLLEFFAKPRKNVFIMVNEAWIWNNKGQLDVRDALGGMYEYDLIKGHLLPKLKRNRPTILSVSQVPKSALCTEP